MAGPHIAEQLLDDRRAGLKTDAGGRRYFRQRRVVFRTIGVAAEDLYDGEWLGFERPLAPLDWSGWPTHADIREFSRLSSERFLAFWYRVLDVSVARALAGRDKEIFRVDFFRASPLLDLGIPVEQEFSTVPAALHRKIIQEYRDSLARPVAFRVFYLSDYLTGLSDDVRAALAPYARLWDLHRTRRELLGALDELPRRQRAAWVEFERGGRSLHERMLAGMDAYLGARLARTPPAQTRGLESESLRHLIYRLRSGQGGGITPQDRAEILRHERELGLPVPVARLHDLLRLPDRLRGLIRSALVQNSAAYRLDLRLTRLQYLHRQQGLASAGFAQATSSESIRRRRDAHHKSFRERVFLLQNEFLDEERRVRGRLGSRALHALALYLRTAEEAAAGQGGPAFDELLARWQRNCDGLARGSDGQAPAADTDLPEPVRAEERLAREAFDLLLRLRAAEAEIVKIHHEFARAAPPAPESDDRFLRPGPGDARYHRLEQLELPAELVVGNPFHEFRILQYARDLLLRRLRPVRRTASSYSLNPGHRHGAMTLNPIMKLWKDRPNGSGRAEAALAGLEINTRQTIECLVRLAELVDPALGERELERYRTVREKRGREDLSNLTYFLLPGSAFPLREIHRLDFPEFRGRVIGESRSPGELGVPKEEDAVLTGAWYQKNNHTLYYPVGGDNGALLRLIWQSGRSPGPPAFYFALGQLVHDCLPENLTYFRSGEVTFRECIEDYYLMEDRVRKNRGEKTGRRRIDNSRPAIRFMFAVCYARLVLEALTGSSQSHFRHRPTERWLQRHLGLPLLADADRTGLKSLRSAARELIRSYD